MTVSRFHHATCSEGEGADSDKEGRGGDGNGVSAHKDLGEVSPFSLNGVVVSSTEDTLVGESIEGTILSILFVEEDGFTNDNLEWVVENRSSVLTLSKGDKSSSLVKSFISCDLSGNGTS